MNSHPPKTSQSSRDLLSSATCCLFLLDTAHGGIPVVRNSHLRLKAVQKMSTHTHTHMSAAAQTVGIKVVWLQQKHELIKQATFSKLWSQLMIPCFSFVISFHVDLWKRCTWLRIKILVNNQLEDQVFWYSARVEPRSPDSSPMVGLTFSRSSTRVNTGWNHLFRMNRRLNWLF